jgi:hypothetical protein
MSEEESFLARWSRRKRDVSEGRSPNPAAKSDPAADEPERLAAHHAEPDPQARPSGETVPFDISTLPPIESITAATDVRAFLAPGVPAELARAALRRAWSADPTIRDFVGIAENQWDFTTAGATPGFGPLEATEEIRRLVERIVGKRTAEQDDPSVLASSSGDIDPQQLSAEPAASASVSTGTASSRVEQPEPIAANLQPSATGEDQEPVAVQHESEKPKSRIVGKGGALPH